MTSVDSSFPAAISLLGDDDTRESQAIRAIRWITETEGGPILVVTPNKGFDNEPLQAFVQKSTVTHRTWKGFSPGTVSGHRVIMAWPNKERLSELWNLKPDALVVIEWANGEAAYWAEHTMPVRLLPGHTILPEQKPPALQFQDPLPHGLDQILEYISSQAAAYHAGLKWNEVDQLKADMMKNPVRWQSVPLEKIEHKLRSLKMRPKDIDKVLDLVRRRQEGRTFRVNSSYRDFAFPVS